MTIKGTPNFAYQAVYRYLNQLIDTAQCGLEVKLPSLRHLAERLKVSVSTVQYAYLLLEREGRVSSIAKSGYFTHPGVDRLIPENRDDLLDIQYARASRPGVFALSDADPTTLSSLAHPLLKLERELIRHYPRRASTSSQPFGDLELRTALADCYTRSAEDCWCSDNVYIGADSTGILKVVLNTLALRGGTVLVESPCSWTILRVLKSFGIRVLEMAVDERGCADLGWVEDVLHGENVGLALLSSRLGMANRVHPSANQRQVADLLNQYDVRVLEDDSQSDLCFTKAQSRLRDWINPDRLMIFSAFDTVIGAEAPFGYLLCKPLSAELQRQFLLRSFKLPPIRQKAIARLYGSGHIEQHISELRRLLEDRTLVFAKLLHKHTSKSLYFRVPDGGAGIWVQSIWPVNMRGVFQRLLKHRILIAPGEMFSLQGQHSQNLRLSVALDWNQDIAAVLTSLDLALRQGRC